MTPGSGEICLPVTMSTSGPPLGSMLCMRLPGNNAECMLAIIHGSAGDACIAERGATPEGKKELIGFQVGLRNSTMVAR
jgi:hypothetical protein